MPRTTYYYKDFNARGSDFQGQQYFKITEDIEVRGLDEPTQLIMVLNKTSNPDNTVFYSIRWSWSTYVTTDRNLQPQNGGYFNKWQKVKNQITRAEEIREDGLGIFFENYKSLYEAIYNTADVIKPYSTLYKTKQTRPPFATNQLTEQHFYYFSNSKTNGSLVTVSWDSSRNCNMMGLSLVTGNKDQSAKNPIKAAYTLWNSSEYAQNYGNIFDELYYFNIYNKKQAEGENLSPFWYEESGGGGIDEIATPVFDSGR